MLQLLMYMRKILKNPETKSSKSEKLLKPESQIRKILKVRPPYPNNYKTSEPKSEK